jgi:hypothetical protein
MVIAPEVCGNSVGPNTMDKLLIVILLASPGINGKEAAKEAPPRRATLLSHV